MKNRIKRGIKTAVLALMLGTVFYPLHTKAAIPEITYDPNDTKTGFHLEVDMQSDCIHQADIQTKTIECNLSGLNRSQGEIGSSLIVTGGLGYQTLFSTRTPNGTGADRVGNIVYTAYISFAGMGVELAGNYTCPGDGYAGYAYFKHYFSHCDYTGADYFVGSGHTWLGCARGDVGINEFHPNDFSHVLTRYKFVTNNYTVTYNGNGATSGSMADQKPVYDLQFNIRANSYKRTGYTFTGWNTKKDGSGTSYKNSESVKNLTATNNGTVTLYAQWKANSYTVKYDGNGATSGSMTDQKSVYDQQFKLRTNNYEKIKYTFTGWNTKKDGSGTTYQNSALIKNLTATNSGIVTLYAQWKANSYTIRFDGNGATDGTMKDVTAVYDEESTLPENGFIRTTEQGESVFVGWNRDSDVHEAEVNNQGVIKNLAEEDGGAVVVLYAIWDDCPTIDACDRYFTLSYAQEGKITEEELLSTATAVDREEGALENRTSLQTEIVGLNGSLSLYGYAVTDFTNLTDSGGVSMTYRAVDYMGNAVLETVTIYVTSTEPVVEEVRYVRSVNKKYYMESYDKGGMHPDSVWRKKEGYKELLWNIFEKFSNNTPEQVYRIKSKNM